MLHVEVCDMLFVMGKLDFSLIMLLLLCVFASKSAIKCKATYVFVFCGGKCGIVVERTVKCVKYWFTTKCKIVDGCTVKCGS